MSAAAKAPKASSAAAPPVADPLPDLLSRLRLTALRDRLDGLLDEAARRDLSLREALAPLCEAEVAHRDQRRVQMGTSIAKFPAVRTLEGFDFAAQPSVGPKLVRDLAACRWVATRSWCATSRRAAGWPTATRC